LTTRLIFGYLIILGVSHKRPFSYLLGLFYRLLRSPPLQPRIIVLEPCLFQPVFSPTSPFTHIPGFYRPLAFVSPPRCLSLTHLQLFCLKMRPTALALGFVPSAPPAINYPSQQPRPTPGRSVKSGLDLSPPSPPKTLARSSLTFPH